MAENKEKIEEKNVNRKKVRNKSRKEGGGGKRTKWCCDCCCSVLLTLRIHYFTSPP